MTRETPETPETPAHRSSPSNPSLPSSPPPSLSSAVVFDPGSGLGSREVALRPAGPGEVEIEVRAAGVCHSDLHIVTGDWPTDRPLVLGHEAAGVVTGVGAGVTSVRPGDHVVLSWFAPCRRCRKCVAGMAWLCTGTKAVENTLPDGGTPFTDARGEAVWPYLGLGAFTDRLVVPETAAVKVPEELPFGIGALLGCSITTGIGAVMNTARVRPGESAVVIGTGGVGLSVVMGLHLVGADPVVAVDLSPERLAVAKRFGATHTLDGAATDVAAWCQEELGGVDFAFEAIGSPAVIETLPAMLTSGGAAVLVGMAPSGATGSFDLFDLADQGKRILGCNYGSSIGEIDIPKLARLHLAGRLPLDDLIGATRPLSEARAAFEDLRSNTGVRTILEP
ncbi:alcohol dehydrogenase catalytic domain-containing protein [Streptomyces sp. MAR25Y5]|uniref:alcohol dehydrogenase catalytic domain-containing protein n=1 Tax=Streptomyces sp. MAR25Y5 TaxID=2962028 RepID=UPI0020B87662|nr:alcohol dehydrogenase catalytic domain-containing protein [Streptomyces sp. MAR25Y5]MCP3766268.1 alcohol dehydrogenase catalytic domain-containing protein [Streptomyces sp. MAR25Y5]